MTRERLVLGALLAAALLLPAVVRSPYVLHVAALAGIYVILTLSLNLVTGFCGQFSLGHAGFYGIGAYTAALLAVNWGSPFVLNLPAAAATAGAAGFLIGLPTLRLGGIYLAMATLGFGEIIHLILLNWLAVTRGPLGIPAIPGPALLGVDLATPARQYYVVFALVVIATVIVSRLVDSSFGEAIQAIREDEVAAQALGVPTTRLKVVTFTLSAALAGVAGAFFAHYATFVSPGSFTLVESILVLSLLVFGGMGSVEGSIAGAVILTVAPEVFRFLAEYRMVIYGAILLGLILFRPQGLLGGLSLGLTRRPQAATDRSRRISPHGAGAARCEPVLEVCDLSVQFGGIRAVSGVSLAARAGEILSIIGPNGAGKTTIFNVVTGLYRPTAGEVRLEGRPISALPPHERARLGIARTFQNIRLFRDLTVGENVRVARYGRTRVGLLGALLRTPGFRRDRGETDARVAALLEGVGLRGRDGELARSLPYGDQKRVELARALAAEPSVLLLDEPAAGMSTAEADELMALIRSLRDRGIAILLVEHHIRLVMGVSDRVAVLNHGELIAEGPPTTVRRDPAVVAAYLGGGQ